MIHRILFCLSLSLIGCQASVEIRSTKTAKVNVAGRIVCYGGGGISPVFACEFFSLDETAYNITYRLECADGTRVIAPSATCIVTYYAKPTSNEIQ